MESNPRIPSRLGCGGLLLLALGLPTVWLIGGFVHDLTEVGLVMGDERYRIGEIWWLVGPLGALSIIAVFRLAFGHRDWLAAVIATAWVAIAGAYAVTTGQFSFLAVTSLILFLVGTGTWRARRELEAGADGGATPG